jgi:HSP20 family protein
MVFFPFPLLRRVHAHPLRCRVALNNICDTGVCAPSGVAAAHTRATKSSSESVTPTVENSAVQTRGSHKRGNQGQGMVAHRRHRQPTGFDALFDPAQMTKNFFSNPFSMLQPFGNHSMSPFGQFGSFNMNHAAPQMTLDMYSDSKAYHLSASIPGVDKKDISIKIDDNGMLCIQAERKVERKSDKPEKAQAASTSTDAKSSEAQDSSSSVDVAKKGDSEVQANQDDMEFHFVESSYGLVERSISLPEDVDVDKLSAKYENGVLKIELPRLAEPKPSGRTVNIQ